VDLKIIYISYLYGNMAEEICRKGELERLREFLKAKRGMLFYHGDADGVCSAALFLKFFRDFEFCPRKGPRIGEDLVGVVLDKKPKLLVFLDLPVDQERKKLDRFLREIPGLRIVIIDHHIAERDISSDRIVHVNPRFVKEGVYIPAACAVYRILEGFGKKVGPLVWVAALGVIGDYEWRGCRELIEECREEYPYLLEGEPLESRLGEGADTIAAAATLKGMKGIAECLKVLMDSEGFEQFGGNRKLQEWRRIVDDEVRAIEEDFRKSREVFRKEGLVVYEVKSGINLTSLVATNFGEKLPGKVVAIRKALGDEWKVSLRSQKGKADLGRIVKACVKGIGSGGGHERAAAALVKDWNLFLKRLKVELRRASA
jgi:single-stranded DNA-specific DHH superfamily exonuclease